MSIIQALAAGDEQEAMRDDQRLSVIGDECEQLMKT